MTVRGMGGGPCPRREGWPQPLPVALSRKGAVGSGGGRVRGTSVLEREVALEACWSAAPAAPEWWETPAFPEEGVDQ